MIEVGLDHSEAIVILIERQNARFERQQSEIDELRSILNHLLEQRPGERTIKTSATP